MSTPAPNVIEQLDQLLQQNVDLLNQLGELLTTELQSLEARDLERLTDNNKLKQGCLLELDRAMRARDELLRQYQVSPNTASVMAFLQQLPLPHNTRLVDTWHTLERSLDDVKQLNLRNEQVILRNKQNADQLLALLQGHARSNTLYDQKGDEGRYEGQRSLGKA